MDYFVMVYVLGWLVACIVAYILIPLNKHPNDCLFDLFYIPLACSLWPFMAVGLVANLIAQIFRGEL